MSSAFLPGRRCLVSLGLRDLRVLVSSLVEARFPLLVLFILAATCGTAPTAAGDDSSLKFQAQVGLGGVCKAGRWAAVRVPLAERSLPNGARIELSGQDGDGLNVRYTGRGEWHYAKHGPVRDEMLVRAVGADGDELGVQPIAVNVLPSTDRLFVIFGSLGDLDANILRRAGLKREPFTLTSFQDPANFPDHWIGYDAVDTLVITTRDVEPIQQLTDEQVTALRRWVEMGGRLLLSVGESGSQLLADESPWADFLPGTFQGVSQLRSTSGLETFANAVERLEPIPSVELSDARGLERVYQGVGSRRDQPLVVESPFGFGQVVFIAFDLDAPAIGRWQGRGLLLGKLLVGEQADGESVRDDSRGQKITHYGYEDITGQLRASLDQFRGVRVVAFSAIAGLIAAYVLLIGPGDYFFLKRIVRRMGWTWLSFPLIVIAFCIATVLIARASRGDRTRINQVDLVDIDVERSLMRTTTWAHLYSPSPQALDLRLEPEQMVAQRVEDVLFAWQGLPGRGLGGLNAPSDASLFPTASYVLAWNAGRDLRTHIHRYPLRPSSAAAFVGRVSGTTEPLDAGALQASGTTNLLTGTIVNPCPETLHDASVLYGDWIYPIEREFEAGARIDMERQLVPRNLSWWLTRRRIVQDHDVSTPWDATATHDVPRIVEMMMFHEAAGGTGYTRLSHRHQPQLDLSQHLRLGRAILVGRVKTPATRVDLEGSATPPEMDQQFTFYRFVIPVESGAGSAAR